MITGVELIDNVIRSFFWWLSSFALWLCDLVYEVAHALLSLDLLNLNDSIWNWFTILTLSFTGIFILFRVAKNFLLDAAEVIEEREPRVDPIRLIVRIICLALVVTLSKPILSELSYASSQLVQNINVFTGSSSQSFSSVILSETGIEANSDGTYDVDINEKEDGKYIYFRNSTDFLIVIITSGVAVYMMAMIAISVGNRFLSMLVKLIIAPWSFSTIVEKNPESFGNWAKLFAADFISNFVVCFCLLAGCSVVLGIDSTVIIGGNLSKCLLLLGVLAGVLNAPSLAAQLIGADIGAATGIQSLSMLMSVGGGFNTALKGVTGATLTGLAGGTYMLGRSVGGINRHDPLLYSQASAGVMGSVVNSLGGGAGVGGTITPKSTGTQSSPINMPGVNKNMQFSNNTTTLNTSSGTNSVGINPNMTDNAKGGMNDQSFARPNKPTRRGAYDNTFANKFANYNKTKFGDKTTNTMAGVSKSLYVRSAMRLNQREINKYHGAKSMRGYDATRGDFL